MRRWNGWGDESHSMDLPENGLAFLAERVGEASPLPDATLEEVLKTVPDSRLPDHPLIDKTPEQRVYHARGQSLPDWLAMKSGKFEVFPDGVAFPETGDDVAQLIKFAAGKKIRIIPYGGGTSVAGHINPRKESDPVLTIDLGRMSRLTDLDEESLIATFGPGTPGPQVEAQLKARGYTLGHFPQSFELSTIGGWVASRSSGQQSLRYGRIEQMFAGCTMETPLGKMEVPTIPASAAGPDVREMVLGSEGRMGIITELKVRVKPVAAKEKFFVIFFPDWQKAKDASRALVQSMIQLSMLRLSNAIETETQLALAGHAKLIGYLERYLEIRGAGTGKCMMTVGITGSHAQFKASLSQLKGICRDYDGVYTGTKLGDKWAEKRFNMPYLRETLWQHGYVVDTLETATDWDNVDSLLNKMEDSLRHGLDRHGEKVHVFTHLSHFYPQGCSIYTTYAFRTGETFQQTLDWWSELKTTTSEIIVNNRGTISHQHGVGKDHAPYLPTEKGRLGMQAINALIKEFDPDAMMNPGTLLVD
ncbi:MAG: FAD-binding oxidoreductase [Proteobacteria bacterium]|nr:MAG: FAD-binding oxidoreductase [Pseudomonadota bacterium]PIE40395.1 MAG: FAD-binding oxidoreductase [Gammaproteobacteria bacterium]